MDNNETKQNDNNTVKPHRGRNTRARRRAIVRRNRRIALVVVIVVVLVAIFIALYAAGIFEKRADTTTLELKADGSVIFEEVSDLEDENYKSGDIKSYAKDLIKDYNNEHDGIVKFQRFKMLDDDTAYLRIKYDSYDTYLDFTGLEGFIGSVKDAKAAGFDMEVPFLPARDGTVVSGSVSSKSSSAGAGNKKLVTVEEATADKDAQVLVIREIADVKMEKDVMYVSEEGVSLLEDGTIRITPVGDSEDVALLTYVIFK